MHILLLERTHAPWIALLCISCVLRKNKKMMLSYRKHIMSNDWLNLLLKLIDVFMTLSPTWPSFGMCVFQTISENSCPEIPMLGKAHLHFEMCVYRVILSLTCDSVICSGSSIDSASAWRQRGPGSILGTAQLSGCKTLPEFTKRSALSLQNEVALGEE